MKKVINYVVIVIAVLMLCFGLIIDFGHRIQMSGTLKIVIYVTPMLLLFINMIVQMKSCKDDVQKEKIKRQMLFGIFIIYTISIATLLFLGSAFRFRVGDSLWGFDVDRVNLIPFSTIIEFGINLVNGNNSFRNVFINIVGNGIAFAPMGFFVPILFSNKIDSFKKFTILMIIIIFGVELIQFMLGLGVADIDDIILNTLGAVIVYMFMQTKIAKSLVEKIFK